MFNAPIRRTAALVAVCSLSLELSAVSLAQDTKPKQDSKQETKQPARQDVKPTVKQEVKAQQPVKQPEIDDGKPAVPSRGGPEITEAQKDQSPLRFDNWTHDFGDVADTHNVTTSFHFTNVSGETIEIDNVRASCGCTQPQMANNKMVYAPGESGEMTVSFRPQKRRGAQHKDIRVSLKGPNAPTIKVAIEAFVRPLMVIEPNKLFLNSVQRDQGLTTTLEVSGRSSDFDVTSVESDSEWVDVTVGDPQPSELDGSTMRMVPVTVTVKPGAPIGRLESTLMVHTNDERVATEPVNMIANVLGDLRATPERLTIRETSANTAFEADVRLDSRTDSSFDILSISTENGAAVDAMVDFEVREVNGVPVRFVRISGITPDALGLTEGTIVISTNLNNDEVIRIPFYANIRSGGRPQVKGAPTKGVDGARKISLDELSNEK